MTMVSSKINQDTYLKIKDAYQDYVFNTKKDYVVLSIKYNSTFIDVYQNKKGEYKVVINGPLENEISKKFSIENSLIIKEKITKNWIDLNEQIGSDEVGVGDLFLPMIVVAAYVSKNDIQELKNLGIDDSKKLSDEKIKKLGPSLILKYDFSKLTLSNEKYNEMILKGENLNSLKARMHNQALYNMYKKHNDVKHIYIDQFVNENKYFEYLKKDKTIIENIILKTKGESYYPSVALASIIARYSFLLEKEKLEKQYNVKFPFGAGAKADEFLKSMIDKYPFETIKKIAKLNFKNIRDLNKLV